MMELRHLRYFLAVADEGNVTRAAARLGISQPPLSQQLKALEDWLGATLFVRSPQGMQLTAAGEAFQAEALRTLQAAEVARHAAVRAAQGHTGVLRVGFTGSASFHPAVAGTLRDFRRQWPQVQLALTETNTTRLTAHLHEERLDCAFLRPGATLTDAFRVLRLEDEAMKVVLPVSHPLAHLRRVGLARLAHDPWVLFPRSVGLSLYDAIWSACRVAGFEPQVEQTAPQMASVIHLVAAEMGVSVVTASMAQVQAPGVVYLDIVGAAPKATLGLARVPGEASPCVANFCQVFEQGWRQRSRA
jgi:DNA-binding transcriptional LysR family regulator